MDERGQRLILEAGRVFWTYGIKSVTMDDVASRLGISKKTLYQYVKDKNDLVERVLLNVSASMRCEIEGQLGHGGNAIDELYAITTRVAAHLKGIHPSIHFDLEKYHPEAFLLWRTNKRKEIFNSTADNLLRGIREGLYREDLNIPMITTIYIARFDMVFDGALFPPEKFDMDELHWELFRYHVRGIASTKGLNYLKKKVLKEMKTATTRPHASA